MSEEKKKVDFELEMDEETLKKFTNMMKDEGLMRAGFVVHESNNSTLTLKFNDDSETSSDK